ncbi:hypothetical protein ACJX0J_033190, partial [Zea mays]
MVVCYIIWFHILFSDFALLMLLITELDFLCLATSNLYFSNTFPFSQSKSVHFILSEISDARFHACTGIAVSTCLVSTYMKWVQFAYSVELIKRCGPQFGHNIVFVIQLLDVVDIEVPFPHALTREVRIRIC